jgi:hypothetical protein
MLGARNRVRLQGRKMPEIKWREMKVLDDVLQMEGGYVLDFSDRTMREFFHEEFDIDIDAGRYRRDGSSKGRRLRCFLKTEPGHVVGRVLRRLWTYRMQSQRYDAVEQKSLEQQYFAVVSRLEGTGEGLPLTDAIERFSKDETLDELVATIERDISANKPQVALDRLHTYCMKKFAHLLRERGDQPNAKETLNARAGRYFNPMRRAGVRPITDKIMRSSVELLEMYNSVRNNESLAHDNELIEAAEARFIFDSVVSMLRFVKAHEPTEFGA